MQISPTSINKLANNMFRTAQFICSLIGFLFLSAIIMLANPVGEPLYKEIDRVALNFGGEVFAHVLDIDPLPDGFVFLLNKSAYGDNYLIIKLDKQGKFLSKYDKQGHGPGELGRIRNIVVTNESIFVAEAASPFVHELSHKLSFKKDYRVESQGKLFELGKYFGIWTPYLKETNGEFKNYMLALYDKKKFSRIKYAVEVKAVPESVHSWGGICRYGTDRFACLCSNEYEIKIFDTEFNHIENLIKEVPPHVIKYRPYKGKKNVFDKSTMNWLQSWSKMHSIYFIDGKFLINHVIKNEVVLDIYTDKGNAELLNIKVTNGLKYVFFDGKYFWRLDWKDLNDENDTRKYWLVKDELNL